MQTNNLSEKEKIALAKQALKEYMIIMQQLTEEQRQILSNAMKRMENKKIEEIEEEIKNI
jgi:FixJ family two-component response regulator